MQFRWHKKITCKKIFDKIKKSPLLKGNEQGNDSHTESLVSQENHSDSESKNKNSENTDHSEE